MRPCPHVKDGRHTGNDHSASTYPSGRCSPPYVDLCTCSKSKLKIGREREKSVIYRSKKQESLLRVTFLITILKRDPGHHKIIACDKKQACNKNNNSNINSTSRLDISWLKLHLRVSPAHVGVLTIELLFLNAIKPVITAQKLFICETRPPGAKCKTCFFL